MSKMVKSTLCLLAGSVLLAACSSGPLRSFEAGDELATYAFAEARTFEEGAYPDATLRVINDAYRITLNSGDSEVWWAQWGDSLADVILDVEIEQVSERNENAYGVACRLRGQVGQQVAIDPALAAIATGDSAAAEATEEAETTETDETSSDGDTVENEEASDIDSANGDGYLFLIRGEGAFAILRSRNRDLIPLVDWTQSDVINQGPGRNELRAVCMGDYLALYINGEFMADATDTTYDSGQVGLAASASSRLGVKIEFDNLMVHEALAG